MTPPSPDDVWKRRRRLGDALTRWAGSARRPATGEYRPTPVRRSRRKPRGGCVRRLGRLHGRDRDRGAATIIVLAIGLVLVSAGGAGAAVGAARVGRHQAQVAADLGALAGAARAIDGQEAACAAAGRFVAANHGRMSSCAVQGLEIVVRAEVEVNGLPGPARRAHAAARAGPVSAI